jgi:hypothetical protein
VSAVSIQLMRDPLGWVMCLVVPDDGVDGQVLDGHAVQCFLSLDESNRWITIDLGATYTVKYVTLFNGFNSHGNNITLKMVAFSVRFQNWIAQRYNIVTYIYCTLHTDVHCIKTIS